MDASRMLHEHWRNGCEMVHGTIRHQAALRPVRDDLVTVVVSPVEGRHGYDVALSDGTVVGQLRQRQLARIVMSPDCTTVAEVCRAAGSIKLFIPLRRRCHDAT